MSLREPGADSGRLLQANDQTMQQLEQFQQTILQGNANEKVDCDILSAVVKSVSSVISGESVVSTPASNLVPWLGVISVSVGKLKGPSIKQYRTYVVESQILAQGHVLPWRISATWRYSQLRALLVDSLQTLLFSEAAGTDLWLRYADFVETFPSKSWSNRLRPDLAAFRSTEIQGYIDRGIEITTQLIVMKEFDLEVLWSILHIFTYDLLDLKPDFQEQIAELSANLGIIISSAPKDHCLLDNDFVVAPQQGL